MAHGSSKGVPIDVDNTLSQNSDALVPSQKAIKSYVDTNAQDTLVSGTNIKTVNGNSLLGSGNISISGATLADGDYGDITVGGSGTTMTIDNLAVTDAKINDVAATKVTTDSTHRFVTDTQLTVIGNTSGTNTGDQTSIVGISGSRDNFDTACTDANFLYVGDIVNAVADGSTKGIASFTANDFDSSSGNISIDYTNGQSASGSNKGFLTSADWNTFNGKQAALTNPVTGTGTNNEIAAFNSTGSTITSLTTATYPSLTELSYVKGVTSSVQTQLNGKEPTITNGFGISGTTTKAVSLTNSSAFCTAETTISAVTYADITGASITLAAGTWLLMATINGASQTTTVAVMMVAITDGANTVIAEGSQHLVAGTATVRTWGNVSLNAIVTPAGSTTYKLRGARGTTTQTGNWIASDGNGVNTVNNVSNNSDKGTAIMAVRIA